MITDISKEEFSRKIEKYRIETNSSYIDAVINTFEEYSYEEISEALDLPLGTVKAQLFRAREFLFNILKNSEDKI